VLNTLLLQGVAVAVETEVRVVVQEVSVLPQDLKLLLLLLIQ
jgi:hypothetical protein